MKTREIEDLLNKYYEGETSAEEEVKLKEYFIQENVPSHLSVHARILSSFDAMNKEELSDPGFEAEVLSKIDKKPIYHLFPKRSRYYYFTGIAAGILLLVGIFFTFRQATLKNNNKENIQDVSIAYDATLNTLRLVSSNFNNGLSHISSLNKFDKGMQDIQKISLFYQYQPLIINQDE